MLTEIDKIGEMLGHTPILLLENLPFKLYCKIESQNFAGSIKARPAFYILKNAILQQKINQDTLIVESSSGNFALALAKICQRLEIKFIPIIDPNINSIYKNLLIFLAYKVIKVTQPDKTGGYLLTRIDKVKEICKEENNSFWTNQYENIDNFNAHYHSTASEICNQFNQLDYIFIAVSSGGTISGISKRLKEKFPKMKVIAVDVEGSVIFGGPPKKRYIPGMGASKVPPLIKYAEIDDVIYLGEYEALEGCYSLLKKHSIFAGGSTGVVYQAIQKYFEKHDISSNQNVLFLAVDGGMPYVDTIYNSQWAASLKAKLS